MDIEQISLPSVPWERDRWRSRRRPRHSSTLNSKQTLGCQESLLGDELRIPAFDHSELPYRHKPLNSKYTKLVGHGLTAPESGSVSGRWVALIGRIVRYTLHIDRQWLLESKGAIGERYFDPSLVQGTLDGLNDLIT